MRGTQWVWTLNNPTEDELGAIRACYRADGPLKYLLFGKEIAPETGTEHLQGYLQMRVTSSAAQVERLLGGRAWIQKAKGSYAKNKVYCSKDESWEEFGEVPKSQGHRSDLDSLHQFLDEGATIAAVSDTHFGSFLRYGKMIEKYVDLHSLGEMRQPPKILWMYGDSGAGKTRKIMDIVKSRMEDTFFLQRGVTGCWWTGYRDQKVVVMDDLRPGWMPHSQLIRVLDSTPLRVSVHGGSVSLKAETFLISTNLPPSQLYEDDPSGALARRIEEWALVVCYGSTGPVVKTTPTQHPNLIVSEF